MFNHPEHGVTEVLTGMASDDDADRRRKEVQADLSGYMFTVGLLMGLLTIVSLFLGEFGFAIFGLLLTAAPVSLGLYLRREASRGADTLDS